MKIEVTQEDREAAASVAVLTEMRELIRAGNADHHAEPFARYRIAAYEKGHMAGYEVGVADGKRLANSDIVAIKEVTLDELARMARKA